MIQQGSIDFRIDWLGTEKTKKKENDGTVDVVTNDARRGRRQRRVDDPDGRRRRRHLGRRGHAGRDGVGLCRAALPLPRPAAARPRPLVLRPTGPHGPLLLLQERREQRLLFFSFFLFFCLLVWFPWPCFAAVRPFVYCFFFLAELCLCDILVSAVLRLLGDSDGRPTVSDVFQPVLHVAASAGHG